MEKPFPKVALLFHTYICVFYNVSQTEEMKQLLVSIRESAKAEIRIINVTVSAKTLNVCMQNVAYYSKFEIS